MKKRQLAGMMAIAMTLNIAVCGRGTSNITTATTADTIIAQTGAPAAAVDIEAQASDQTLSTAISIVVPAGAGNNADLSTRAFAEFAKKVTGANLIIVNTNGAIGSMVANQVLSATPDGYAFLYGYNPINVANISDVTDYNYTAFKLGPIFALDPIQQMYANPDKYRTLDDFIKAAEAAPEQLKAYTEVGAYTYYELLTFEKAAGIDLDLADVGSNSGKMAAVLSERVGLMPGAYINYKDYLEAGRFVCLDALTEERYDLVRDIPTLKGQGVDLAYPNYEFSFYFPRETPNNVIAWYDNLVKEMTSDSEAQGAIKKVEMEPYYLSAANSEKNDERIYTEIKEVADNLAK